MKYPSTSFLSVGACFCLLTASLFGQGIVRVKDINAEPVSAGTFLGDAIANVNGTLFIATDDNLSGAELWKSTEVGGVRTTVLVEDIVPGPEGSNPEQLTAVGTGTAARLFFLVTIDTEKQLWISDGTAAGTKPVEEANVPVLNLRDPDKLFAFGNVLYFEGDDSKNGREPWTATLAGKATLLTNLNGSGGSTGTQDSNIGNFAVIGGKLYFTAAGTIPGDGDVLDATGNELWVTQGTAATTALVADLVAGPSPSNPLSLRPFTNAGDSYLFFSASTETGRETWRYQEGAPFPSEPFMDIELLEGSSDPADFTQVGDNLFFSAKTPAHGRELWLTDGISVIPTEPLRNIRATTEDSNPAHLTPLQTGATNQLIFTADDGNNGVELWRSNGTFAGTTMVQNIAAGAASSNPSNFFVFGPSTVIFTATDAADVLALWKCEGSTGNPVATKVIDLPAPAGGGTTNIRGFVFVPGTTPKLYFMLNEDEFWQTDGTAVGTTRIKRFRIGDLPDSGGNPVFFTANSDPADFTPHGAGTAFFTANDGVSGPELWKTDGTDGGTVQVDDIFTGNSANDPRPLWLTSAGTHLFFNAAESGTDRELWRTDGTTAELVKDINPTGQSNPQNLFWSTEQNLLFFSATDGTEGRELWRSDGTDAGTFMVKEMVNFGDSNPRDLVLFRGKVWYVGSDGTFGTELMSSAGVLDDITVLNVASGGGSSSPTELVVMKNNLNVEFLYFSAAAGNQAGSGANSGRELWKSDGTVAGTVRVKDIISGSPSSSPHGLTVVGKTLFFAASNSSSGTAPNIELWKSDGVVDGSGTAMVAEIAAGSVSSSPEQLTAVGNKLFFVANNSTTPTSGNGAELWVSDGTAGGTKIVKDIVVGPGSPGIQNLISVNGVAVFTANDGTNGREVWVSDGTPVGTFMVRDLTGAGDVASSSPQHLTDFGGRLLYSAATYNFGQEPRLGTLDPEIAVAPSGGPDLVSGVGSTDFGNASLINFKTVQFVIRNDGLNSLKSLAATISGTNAADFSVVVKPPTTLGPDATFALSIKFAPKVVGPRAAILTIGSTDPNEGSFVINLEGTGEEVFTQLPLSQMAVVGSSVTFTVGVSAAGDTLPAIQWKKGAAIAGATDDEYTINSVTLAHAGDYTVQAKVGTVMKTTDPVAKLGVVDNTSKILVVANGANATLKVDAKGTGHTFQWFRKFGSDPEEPLAESAHFKGVIKNTLTINKVVAGGAGVGDTATYFCKVTGPGPTGPATVEGGTTILKIFSSAPAILTFDPPDGIVSGKYSYPMDMNTDPTMAPTGFTAKNLPTGLKIDPKSGLISGFPTKAGTFKVTVTASNTKGKAISAEAEVVIAPFPDNLAGTYAGLVERNAGLNSNMGGRFDIVITATGTFTGSVTLGVPKVPLKGQLDVSVSPPEARVEVKRTGLPNLIVTFEIASNTIAGDSQVSDGSNISDITAWRQIWSTKAGATPGPATAYVAYYTFGIKLAGGPDTLPQGWGYGSFKVLPDGKFTIAGKTADGEGITCGAFIGPNGEMPIFQPLYTTTPKGSLLGQMTIGLGTDTTAGGAADNTVGGFMDWVRPLDTRATARTYEDGFGHTGLPVELDIFGSPYGPVAGDTMVMGIAAGVENVQVTFVDGGVELSNTDPDLIFDLGAKNKVTLPKGAVNNPAAVTFSLTASSGIFSGSFTLADPDPRKPGATFKRPPTKFFGIIINDGTTEHGVGHFMLPQLGEPLPSPVTHTNSDILSGSVEFSSTAP